MNSHLTVDHPMQSASQAAARTVTAAVPSSDADLNPLWLIAGAMAIFFALAAGLLAMS
jgi:hypothetical protein